MFMLWCIGALFTDGLLDPIRVRTFKEQAKSFFLWPWELGQFVRVYLDGGKFLVRTKGLGDELKCPSCGGLADNGHDRCYPPNSYNCTKCDGGNKE